jgi:CHAD domain-containing protein
VREKLGDDLRWLGGLLGTVRDLDVRIARLAESRLALPEAQRGALAAYEAHVSEERELRRVEMLAGIDSARYFKLLVRLERFTSGDGRAGSRARAAETLGRVAHRSLRRLADRLAKAGKAVEKEPSPEALHRLRIRAKRLRYVLAFLEEALGKHAHGVVRSLARIQDALGTHRDALVSADELSRFAGERAPSLDPTGLMSVGALIGMESARAERALSEFEKLWKRWTSKRSRRELADVLSRSAG